MLAFHSDAHSLALPPGHRFPQSKYRLLREQIERAPGAIRLRAAAPASEGELALAHSPDYVDKVLQGHLSAAEQREIGFPWSPSMAARSRHSVGASIEAARAALAEGVAANLAGGTHHAHADKGSGYCVFNDVAVAARLMQTEWHRTHGSAVPGLRVLVIDLDVHQGNGTAAIFRDDPTVFTFSMHGAKNFPFRKEPSDLDVELPDGCRASGRPAAASGWPSTWPAPTRTRATAWAGSSSAPPACWRATSSSCRPWPSAASRWRWPWPVAMATTSPAPWRCR